MSQFLLLTVTAAFANLFFVNEFLNQFRDKKFVGVGELAAAAARILIENNTVQERVTVSALPDERTIRYYLSESLLSPSDEKQGTASVFDFRHLLQLLAIKKLQSDHLSIRQIRKIVAERNAAQLEDLLEVKTAEDAKNEAQKFLENLLLKSESPSPTAPPGAAFAPSPQTNASASSTGKLRSHRTLPILNNGIWERFEIETGIELHISENFAAPADGKEIGRLLQKVQQLIENYRPRKRA